MIVCWKRIGVMLSEISKTFRKPFAPKFRQIKGAIVLAGEDNNHIVVVNPKGKLFKLEVKSCKFIEKMNSCVLLAKRSFDEEVLEAIEIGKMVSARRETFEELLMLSDETLRDLHKMVLWEMHIPEEIDSREFFKAVAKYYDKAKVPEKPDLKQILCREYVICRQGVKAWRREQVW